MLESIDYLEYHNKIVGWRFTARNYQKKMVRFDVPRPLCSCFLRMMYVRGPDRKTKYSVFLKDKDGCLVSDDEKYVYEVTSAKQGQFLLNKYYFCFDLKDEYVHATDCNFTYKNGRIIPELYDSYRRSFTQGLVQSRENLKYRQLGKIPRFHNIILNAASAVRCNILFSEHIHNGVCDSCCKVIFSELSQLLSFIYNLLTSLNREAWIVTLSSLECEDKQYKFKLGNCYQDFLRNVTEGFGVNPSGSLMYEQIGIYGEDDICKVTNWGYLSSERKGAFYCLNFTISEEIPSPPVVKKYNSNWV